MVTEAIVKWVIQSATTTVAHQGRSNIPLSISFQYLPTKRRIVNGNKGIFAQLLAK